MPLAFDRIRLLVPDSVISRPVDGITVVVDVATGRSFTLDEVGTRVWELLTTMPSAQAAYETLLQEFDADPSQMRDDVERPDRRAHEPTSCSGFRRSERRHLMSYVVVSSHRGMALDAGRNEAYARALAAAITPDSVVLDLGAGTGVHGLMAARLGARRVYLVEPEDIIALAEENVRANGLQDVVQCIQGRIEDVTLPEPVDVIVSVLTGNFLLTEDLLPVLFHARDRFLRPGGT